MNAVRRGLLPLLSLALAACSTFSERIATVERRLLAGDYGAAAEALEQVGFARRDEVLKLLNRGMIARWRGDFSASNADLEAAKQAMTALSALSLREVALASTVTEQAGAYAGQPFERLLVPVFKAVNFLDLGRPDDARVEALQIDLLLREIAEGRDEAGIPGSALARYLSGIVFELGGERSDAYIAYRRAAENYRAPSQGGAIPATLENDLRRLARRLGRDDLPEGVDPDPGPPDSPEGDDGELIVFVTAGLAPALREAAAVVPEPVSGRLMRIALPTLVPRAQAVASVTLHVEAGSRTASRLADLLRIARADLDARLPGMTARLIARQVVKSQVVREAGRAAVKHANDSAERVGAGLLVLGAELTALLTERADTRSWLALPGDVFLARMRVPAGSHRAELSVRGHYNERGASRSFDPVVVAPGERRWLSVHLAGAG